MGAGRGSRYGGLGTAIVRRMELLLKKVLEVDRKRSREISLADH